MLRSKEQSYPLVVLDRMLPHLEGSDTSLIHTVRGVGYRISDAPE